ncbi:MAG: hypothetical protein HQK57_02480 [Deltaproteobacteria bacterium]|nr:hypothetical protein [Deltaproteobacteria bacterium]MBF0523682.1 hypothetical protein [Deltaproteobacteria bacterium]
MLNHITVERGDTSTYKLADIIMMMVMGVLGGAKHISHLAILRTDTVLRTLFGWVKLPDDTTISRIFNLFTQRHCNELAAVEDQARRKVWKIIVRADSAFFDGALLDLLETIGALFLIKDKMKNLETLLRKQSWSPVKNQPGVEAAVLRHQCRGWRKAVGS